MKKLLVAVVAIVSTLFTGCDKELPTVEEMQSIANTAGITAGFVANMTKMDEKTKAIVIDIVNKVKESTPAVGQNFTDAWTPIADKYISELVAKGKIDETAASLIKSVFSIAVKGIDYAVFKKYPKIGEDIKLVEAASNGFCGGFLSVFAAISEEKVVGAEKLDKELYDYLTK